MSDMNEINRKVGEIDANVKTLLKRTEGFDTRLSAVEKKVWWASGASSIVAFFIAHIGFGR